MPHFWGGADPNKELFCDELWLVRSQKPLKGPKVGQTFPKRTLQHSEGIANKNMMYGIAN